MKNKKSPALRRGLAIGTTAGVAFALASALGAAPASAAPVNIDYKCTFPLIGERAIKVAIETNIPAKVQVGQPTPKIQVKWVATMGADVTEGLTSVDAATIGGVALAQSTATVPEAPGGIAVRVANALKPTNVPATGGFQVEGYGEAPALTFTQTGAGSATLGNMEMTVAPKKADGSLTVLGAFKAPCVQVPGQNNKVASFDIVDEAQTPPTPFPVPSYYPQTPPTGAPGTLNVGFNLKGTTVLKATNSTVPISGSVAAAVDGSTGAVSADLVLNPTKGKVTALGFLPVDVDIAFVPVGKTTGVYANGELTTTSTVTVKLPNFLAFGFLPVGGGDKCRTKTDSKIVLTSAKGAIFNPKKGGTVKSAGYDIAELVDCGILNGILSSQASGTGNTIDAVLTPKP